MLIQYLLIQYHFSSVFGLWKNPYVSQSLQHLQKKTNMHDTWCYKMLQLLQNVTVMSTCIPNLSIVSKGNRTKFYSKTISVVFLLKILKIEWMWLNLIGVQALIIYFVIVVCFVLCRLHHIISTTYFTIVSTAFSFLWLYLGCTSGICYLCFSFLTF